MAAAWAAAAAAIIGAGSSIFGASKAGDAAQQASAAQVQAAQQAQKTQLGIYNQIRSDLTPYNLAGQGAINALSGFAGLPVTPGVTANNPSALGGAMGPNGVPVGMDSAATINLIKQGLQGWEQQAPGAATSILNLINSGAALPQIQAALQSARATTTNPINTAFLDPIIQQANNPVMQSQTAGPNAFTPGVGTPPGAGNALSQLENWPGYQFLTQQGQQAMNRNLAAGGRYMSGAMLKDAQQFGTQNALANSVSPYLQLLQYLGNLGENAGATVGSAGTAAGQGIAGSLMAGGTAAASGATGAANAFNSGVTGVNQSLQDLIRNQQINNMLNPPYPTGFVPPETPTITGGQVPTSAFQFPDVSGF